MHPFSEKLYNAHRISGGLLCVGLDPDLPRLPADLFGERRSFDTSAAILAFNRRIIDATFDLAAAYKPQIAFYAAVAAETSLEQTIRYIRERAPHAIVILDAKRNDVANTAEAYAREAFDRYDADAVTVNAYLGGDSVRPFLTRRDRAAVVLCRTSNAGARDFQDLLIDGTPLYARVAARAVRDWSAHGNLMLVVGSTYPEEMAALRAAHPHVTFLVPGIGAQGGDLERALQAGLDEHGSGMLISASRSINYAGGGNAAAIRAAALELHASINAVRAARSAAETLER